MWQFLASDERPQLVFGDFPQVLQVFDLRFQCVIRAIEPESAVSAAMNSQRAAYGIAKISWTDCVMFGKYLDAIC